MEDSYSQREIALAVGISHQSVGRYLRRINDASISLADALALDDDALEELLERGTPGPSPESFAPIDLASVDRELNSKHPPTRAVLWDEYKRDHPDEQCYSYSQFNAEILAMNARGGVTGDLTHHSDRGVQYLSIAYWKALRDAGSLHLSGRTMPSVRA
jgi:transcriptional regulator with XRE-family HTH domain